MLQVIYLYSILMLTGAGITTLLYFLYRSRTRGRIICYFFNKSRRFYKKAIRPSELGVLESAGKAYTYREEQILYTPAFLFKEPFPSLIYNEDEPEPLNIYQLEIEKLGTPDDEVSASELSKILNDGTVRDFVAAQTKINLTQVTGVILMVGLVLLVAIIGVGYWLKGAGLGE